MAAIVQRRQGRRATLREQLTGLVCLAVIVASIVTFLVALFSGAGQ